MTDWIGYSIQGFCTGIGTASALFFHERYIKPYLEAYHERSTQAIRTIRSLNNENYINKGNNWKVEQNGNTKKSDE